MRRYVFKTLWIILERVLRAALNLFIWSRVARELGVAEFGKFSYFQASVFLLILRRGLQINPSVAIGFLSICAAQMWLEGLNEFIFYFFAALVFRSSNNFFIKGRAL